jgi:hypothetical protein
VSLIELAAIAHVGDAEPFALFTDSPGTSWMTFYPPPVMGTPGPPMSLVLTLFPVDRSAVINLTLLAVIFSDRTTLWHGKEVPWRRSEQQSIQLAPMPPYQPTVALGVVQVPGGEERWLAALRLTSSMELRCIRASRVIPSGAIVTPRAFSEQDVRLALSGQAA